MTELGFEDQNQLRSSFRARDGSPDSVIFTVESNFSRFSSTSGSVDRCSFASDIHDQDSPVSEISLHLAGHDYRETSSGPDLDLNKATVHKNNHLRRKEKVKVQKQDQNESQTEDGYLTTDSARNSFSLALKECQDRRVRSEALLRRVDRQRPASLDFNNSIFTATSSSPRFGIMKKSSVTTHRTGIFPSPGTPNYGLGNIGIQKGWSSERVPLHRNGNRRHVGSALVPFNNGKTLPSKWEDAERWIFSPVSGDGAFRPSYPQPQRQSKSKSGPLGPPGIAYCSLYSPAVPMLEGGNVVADYPFSAGVMAVDGLTIQCGAGPGGPGNFPACIEACMARSVSVHGCSERLSLSSLPGSQDADESLHEVKDAAASIARAVSRRDMATQMSPEGSPVSSYRGRLSFSPSPSILPIGEMQSVNSSKQEVRDVQVDERVTMTRWSKKHRSQIPGKCSENVDAWKRKAIDVQSSGWEVAASAHSISKIKREEAKIAAWENLQKAKAEAAIRKLEVNF
ncbi:unnamed protein product [Ilex paraguariensis]|uniref:Remorin C-terminal domain-containing protein n=1 Tax=Ilex paraguariensis TaxID=185542 RepID=A0ABC8UA70_9AQUA